MGYRSILFPENRWPIPITCIDLFVFFWRVGGCRYLKKKRYQILKKKIFYEVMRLDYTMYRPIYF